MRIVLCLFALGIVVNVTAALTDFVNPFVGTSATGHTFPGACLPFGLVQASPDGGTESWHYCSGYRYEDETIKGFSQSHLNGTGGLELGDVLIRPFVGDRLDLDEKIDKSTEMAKPGYYSVKLVDSGIRAEVTASRHAAIYRFVCENDRIVRLLIDTQWGLVNRGVLSRYVQDRAVNLVGRTGLSGWKKTCNWNVRETGFAVEFDHSFVSVLEQPGKTATEKSGRYVFEFELDQGESLMVKVGLAAGVGASTVSSLPARARLNLKAEIPHWDFDEVKLAAQNAWHRILDVATIEGTLDQKANWYTALYHLCIQPNDIADVGDKPFYSTFSCWDTFRAAGPLYSIICPDRVTEFVDSMLEQGRRTGYLPVWTLWGSDNQCMIGTHSIPMIVDAYLKGIPIDAAAAYAQIKETLTQRHVGRRKENWDVYDKYGYYPFDFIKGESVSRTLECAYDDWCAGVMAERLGRKDDATFFFERASRWKNIFDPSIGFVRGKDSKGNWRKPYDPFALGHGADRANDFTEGNAFQYTWHVMQDLPGLVAVMGGQRSFVEKLDSLFRQPTKTAGMGEILDVTGLIGQYVHGNEPSHHVIYFYPQVGCPEKAAERIREVFEKFYLPKPDGLCGNDDCGQMSAWYLFSAMGFYPFNPCGGEYVIGAPQVSKVVLNLTNGKTFTMTANNLSKNNKYVKSVTLNGRSITNWKIYHADIVKGGDLVFEMMPRL